MMKTARTMAPMREPKVMLTWGAAPKNVAGAVGPAVVPLDAVGISVAKVVAAAVAAGVAAGVALVMMPAATDAGAGVPTTSATAAEEPTGVWKTTCGTVTAVLRTDEVDEPGTTVPDCEHGTKMVVRIWMVVTCSGTDGADGAVVVVAPAAGTTGAAGGVAQVMMAELTSIYGAQIPWKYFWALAISASDPWASIQSKTLQTYSEDLQ